MGNSPFLYKQTKDHLDPYPTKGNIYLSSKGYHYRTRHIIANILNSLHMNFHKGCISNYYAFSSAMKPKMIKVAIIVRLNV